MKTIFLPLLVFICLPVCLLAQAPGPLPAGQDSLQQSLVDGEKQAAGAHLNQRDAAANAFTVASGNFHVNFYRCEWQIDPAQPYINGKVTSCFTITSATNTITYDLSDTLLVDSIIYHGAPLGYSRPGGDALVLQFPATLNTAQKDSVAMYYHGSPRHNLGFGEFSTAIHNGIPVLWTLSEPYGAKEWWPCKNGLTDKADSIDVFVTCPVGYSGTSNGILTDTSTNGVTNTYHFKERYPIATYLVAMAATNYVTTIDSVQIGAKTMPVIMNCYPEWVSYFQVGTDVAKNCLQLFSRLYGEYPFINEHYSQTEISVNGGMEHQTNTFISNNSDQLVGHELCHHWFGDMVTCGSWQDIWLNEGFANYSQFLVVQNFDTSLIMAHLTYWSNYAMSVPNGSVFVTDTSTVARIFSNQLTYAKGGYVVHMLRGVLGDSVFFPALRQYLNDPKLKYGFARTADLERNVEQYSGKNLQVFFQQWIYGQGYPSYSATWTQNTNNWVKVQLSQTTSDPSVTFYQMPVQLEFMNAQHDTIITVNHLQNGQTFWIDPGFKADSMAIDPKLWILAKTKTTQKLAPPSSIANDIKIYPNPAPGQVYISIMNPVTTTINIQLYNALGQLVYRAQNAIGGQDALINVPMGQFARGGYILEVTDNKTIKATKKLVK